jgi:hypothetical protein
VRRQCERDRQHGKVVWVGPSYQNLLKYQAIQILISISCLELYLSGSLGQTLAASVVLEPALGSDRKRNAKNIIKLSSRPIMLHDVPQSLSSDLDGLPGFSDHINNYGYRRHGSDRQQHPT